MRISNIIFLKIFQKMYFLMANDKNLILMLELKMFRLCNILSIKDLIIGL